MKCNEHLYSPQVVAES